MTEENSESEEKEEKEDGIEGKLNTPPFHDFNIYMLSTLIDWSAAGNKAPN